MTLEHQLVIWMVRIMCVLWGIYCVRKQQLLFNNNTAGTYILVFILNALFCPLSILVGIFRYDTYLKPDTNDLKMNRRI